VVCLKKGDLFINLYIMDYLGKDVDKIWVEDGEWCILFNTGVLLMGDFLTFDKN